MTQRRSSSKAFACESTGTEIALFPGEVAMKKRILIVEDCEEQLCLMTRWVAHEDAEVTSAGSGEAALEALASRRFDLLIVDVHLPDMNGLGVAQRAKTLWPSLSIVVITSHGSLEYAQGAIRSGADEFLPKPLKRDVFAGAVRRFLAKRAAPRPTVLAVGAHPDDVEIGCGGRLLQHAALGHRVVVLILSAGEAGGTRGERRNEAINAVKRLGGELVLAELVDTQVPSSGKTIATISAVIEQYSPSTVYTHSIHDNHQDHRAVHQATLVAARAVPTVYCYQSPSSTVDFQPAYFATMGEQLESKLELIACYASQTDKCAYLAPDLIRSTARYWGRYAGNTLVEPFEIVRATNSMATEGAPIVRPSLH